MFQIQNILEPNVEHKVVEEREDRFIGKTTSPSFADPGVEIHEEFLKTHWQRVEEWQDVTEELSLTKNGTCWDHGDYGIEAPLGYRFVKVEAYVIPSEQVYAYGSLMLQGSPLVCKTLLRVERKDDHV